ncbi:MAG: hypothetical protein ACFCGT_12660 [Sandaracinaceae bacterium]
MTHARRLFPSRSLATLLLSSLALALALGGCRAPGALTSPQGEEEEEGPARGASDGEGGTAGRADLRVEASRRPPAGAQCAGSEDCASNQICVESRCRFPLTSVEGEVLATAAEAQAAGGDYDGAIETYDQALDAYARQRPPAPVPMEVACAAASLALRTATDPEARERGAQKADLCFRSSVPGTPEREDTRRALARLRYEGLDLTQFDMPEPAESFFTGERTRPTADAVEVRIDMPELEPNEPRSHAQVKELLLGEQGTNAVTDCFIQDWEMHHERSAAATLSLRYRTVLRDMGSYDVWEPSIEVEAQSGGQDGFEPCLQRNLMPLFEQEQRGIRGEAWEQRVQITAAVQ